MISQLEKLSSIASSIASIVLSSSALVKSERSFVYAIIFISGLAFFKAFAIEPPISPRPIKPTLFGKLIFIIAPAYNDLCSRAA